MTEDDDVLNQPTSQPFEIKVAGGTLGQLTSSATIIARSPPKSDDPLNAMIGQVAVVTAHIEHILDVIIWDLLEKPPAVGACITSELNGLFPRHAVVKKLLHERSAPKDVKSDWQDVLASVQKASGVRNRYIHDPWYVRYSVDDEVLDHGQVKKKPDRGHAFGFEASEAERLTQDVEFLRATWDRVLAARSTIRAALEA